MLIENARMARWMWIVGCLLAACTEPNPASSCADGGCSDPAFPFCDVDGAVSGNPLTCIALSCTPGELVACRDEQTLVCDATGKNAELGTCGYGSCVAEPNAHCPYLEPQYLPNVCDEPAALAELTITNTSTFDTDFDGNCTGGIVAQVGAPTICVVRYRTIELASGAELGVSGSRVVAFVADDELRIDGVLDVSANFRTNGPGGGFIRSGGEELQTSGGGGAGFKTAGAAGGNSTEDGGAVNGGAQSIDPVLFSALLGGTRGNGDTGNAGGAGGGATLVSCRGDVVVEGTIGAGGGGGAAGFLLAFVAVGGCGGGSGGNVILQGMNVRVTGQVFANGGGGGGGRPSNAQLGSRGGDAPRSLNGGSGGLSMGQGDGAGGGGGGLNAGPTVGRKSTDPAASAGGGGGSMGYFQVRVPSGVQPTLTPSMASPAFEPTVETPIR